MNKTSIGWCSHTINPIRARLSTATDNRSGHYCEKISPECSRCYASAMQPRLFGLPEFQEQRKLDGLDIFLDRAFLRQVRAETRPCRIFWCDMSDLFGHWVPDAWIDECFDVMWDTPQHTHLLLTKRVERLVAYIRTRAYRRAFGWTELERTPLVKGEMIHMDDLYGRNQCGWQGKAPWGCAFPGHGDEEESCSTKECPIAYEVDEREDLERLGLAHQYEFDAQGLTTDTEWMKLHTRPRFALPGNVQLGFSAGCQQTYAQSIYMFRQLRDLCGPYTTLFLSAEPLLGPLDFTVPYWPDVPGSPRWSPFDGHRFTHASQERFVPYVNWVIVGGESGARRRPMDMAWLESVVTQCQAAEIPVYVKQASALRPGQQGQIPDEVWALKQLPPAR